MNYRNDLEKIYRTLLEEGLDEKIPKLLTLVKPDIPEKEQYIKWAAQTFDPTKNSEYITWILRMLKKGVIVGVEDAEKVRDRLAKFDVVKRKPQFPKDKRDINYYKTYGDLAEILDEFEGIQTKGELKRSAMEAGIRFIESTGNREGDGISLYIVTTPEAGAKYFRHTEWCVKDPYYFEQYGAPFFFFTNNGDPYTLLHLNSNQCMDVRDRSKDLNSNEQYLMETEEISNYVLEHDNSEESLSFYLKQVGDGYNDEIASLFWSRINTRISEANSELKMFFIQEPYIDYEIDYLEYTAYGSIPYNLEPYKQYIDDPEFSSVIVDALRRCSIYVSEYWEHRNLHEDLDAIRIMLTSETDYYRQPDNPSSQLESFISELEKIERDFDPETFDDILTELLLKAGYISSGWATFKDKVNTRNLDFNHLTFNELTGFYSSPYIRLSDEHYDYPEFEIKDSHAIIKRYKRNSHPYVLLSEFLKPLAGFGLEFHISYGAKDLMVVYKPQYIEDTTYKDYMKGLKAVKNFDTHYGFYIHQIEKFVEKFVKPYLNNFRKFDSYNIPNDIKLPLIKLKTRKDPEQQQFLDLHERTSFSQFFNHRKKLIRH